MHRRAPVPYRPMKQETAARVVLVRAVEETLPERIAPETLFEAHIAAGDPTEGKPWIVRRADYLIHHPLAAYGELLHRVEATLPSAWWLIGVATVLGLISNYLGPSAKIHVIWNPIVILIAWNVLVYVALAIGSMLHHSELATEPMTTHRARDRPSNTIKPHRLVERLILAPALSWLLGLTAGAEQSPPQATGFEAVGRRFAALWWPIARPAFRLWLRRTLHLSAIGIAIGAIVGMYVQGLFFAYDVIWRSTFVQDPALVASILRFLLGPAAFVLGRQLPQAEDVIRLLTVEGDPAAPWIHLYAVSALLFVVIPRTVLAVAASRRLSGAGGAVKLSLDDEYYIELLRKARAISPQELEAGTRNAVREECEHVSRRVAEFVCVALYDERVAPRLWRFRDQGGTLRELEEELARECESFSPQLERELVNAEDDLERRLAERVRRLLGEEEGVLTRPEERLFPQVSAASSRSTTHVGERVSSDVAALVAGLVSTSVAIVAGTVSGGFGKVLGVALLAGLVHSGPVGWVIGAVGGLAASGALFALGREKLRQGVKAVRLPAAGLKVAFSRGRYERLIAEGRTRCEESIRQSLAAPMAQLSSLIAEHLWRRLRELVGEWERPRGARQHEPN